MNYNLWGTASRTRKKLRPSNTVIPAITGTATVGQTLTCSTGTWTNTPTSYKYEWFSERETLATYTSTLVIPAGQSGKRIYCAVTASNAKGPSAPIRSLAVTVS